MWVSENDEWPQIARRTRIAKRIMYALFFIVKELWPEHLYLKTGVSLEYFEIQY